MKLHSYQDYLARSTTIEENRAKAEAAFEQSKVEVYDAITHGEPRERIDGLMNKVDGCEAIKIYWGNELKVLKADNPGLESRKEGAERVKQMNKEIDATEASFEKGAGTAFAVGKALHDLHKTHIGLPPPQPETELGLGERLAIAKAGATIYMDRLREFVGGTSREEINYQALTSPASPDMNRPSARDPLDQYRADIRQGVQHGQSRSDAEQNASSNLYQQLTGKTWDRNSADTLGMAVGREIDGRHGSDASQVYLEIREACQGRTVKESSKGTVARTADVQGEQPKSQMGYGERMLKSHRDARAPEDARDQGRDEEKL